MTLNPIDLDELEAGVQRQPKVPLLRLLTVALQALSGRALVWCCTLGGIALWTFCIWDPIPLRLLGAVGYALTILLPVLWRDKHGG